MTPAALPRHQELGRRRAAGVVALVAAALLVAACGSSNSSASSSPKETTPTPTKEALIPALPDVCSLVTAAEASAAVGTPVTNMAGVSIPGACVYGSANSTASVFIYAQVYPDTKSADSISPDQMAAILNGQYGISNAKAVTGIGDKAFEYTATSSGSSGIAIFVSKANVIMFIVMSPSTDSAKIEQLARTAVGRLH